MGDRQTHTHKAGCAPSSWRPCFFLSIFNANTISTYHSAPPPVQLLLELRCNFLSRSEQKRRRCTEHHTRWVRPVLILNTAVDMILANTYYPLSTLRYVRTCPPHDTWSPADDDDDDDDGDLYGDLDVTESTMGQCEAQERSAEVHRENESLKKQVARLQQEVRRRPGAEALLHGGGGLVAPRCRCHGGAKMG